MVAEVEKVKVVGYSPHLMLESIANCVDVACIGQEEKEKAVRGRYLGYQNLLMW